MDGRFSCVSGRLMRHDPQPDDPYLETDMGECPDCSGGGCGDYGEPVEKRGYSNEWLHGHRRWKAAGEP